MKIFTIIIASLIVVTSAFAQVTVTIDSSVKYQTIEGWGHGGSIFSNLGGFYSLSDTTYAHELSIDYLDYIIDELGLTGSRIWEVGPRTDGTGMDNGDCDSIDWSKFQDSAFFPWHHPYVKYFSDRIKAMGYEPSFYSSPTYPSLATLIKPWVLNHPGERAQQMWANSVFWKTRYGVDMNYAVIYNEPSSPITTAILVEDAKAVGPRFISHGLKTKVQYAEAVTPQTNWNFITPVQNDSDLWPNIGRISYHNYGNYNSPDAYRPYMRDYAKQLGITTAQTEMGDPNFDNLCSDLTLGGVSYWEVAFSGGNTLPIKSGSTQFGFGSKYFRLRQLLHYVRPGDVRISAVSNDSNLHVLAFNNKGKITTIIESITTQMTVTISGLPPGAYGISQSAGDPYQELGIRNVGADGKINVNAMGNSGATTIYPYSGPNHPPTIVSYNTDKGYIFASTTNVNLSVYAVDKELDNLTYQWSVFKQPPGANAIISAPSNKNTSVNGLTSAGMYIFKIDVSDGTNLSSKKVYLYKYDANPPASIGGAGFRFSQPYGLVFNMQGQPTHANVELPTTSCILQVGVGDLAGSDFTGRGKWTLVSAPQGSSVKVDSTIYIYISIRAQVTGMDIPGDYVFKCVVTNPPYADLTCQIICTVHPASSPPVISSITPSPAILTLPDSETKLTAVTSDPEGDLLRHWWAIKSVPAGAKPLFDHQGLPVSNVSGLTVAGNYTFTLRLFDDLHMTTKDVTITVNPATGNTITISSLPAKFCQGEIFTLPYQAIGTYSAGNVFTAQLSDTSGSFSAPVTIGSNSSTISGTIDAVIPQNTVPGTGYRIRVDASMPVTTGSNNGSDIAINPLPVPQIVGSLSAFKGATEHYSVQENPSANYRWHAVGGSIIGTDTAYDVDILWGSGDSGSVKIVETTRDGCIDSTSINVKLAVNSVQDRNTSKISLKLIPNPMSSTSEIVITSDIEINADIQIINSYGSIVNHLGNVFLNEGTQNIDWDGKDMNGESIPSGIYFIKLTSKYGVAVGKMVILK